MKSKLLVFTSNHIYTIGLFITCISILASHVYYVFLTQQFPEQDEHLYLDIAVAFYKMLQNISWNTFSEMMSYLIAHPPIRQPLYSLTILLPLLFVGLENTYKIALFQNGLYYCASIVGVYMLARRFMSKPSSFLASLVFATSGFPLFYLHFTYSETATTTWVVWSLVLLLKTNYFQSKKFSILFGVVLSCALLTRWLSIAFIIGPLLFYFFQTIQMHKKGLKKNATNILWVIVCLIPAIAFYIMGSSAFISYLFKNVQYGASWMVADAAGSSASSPLSLQSVAFYFKIFEQQTIFYFILLLVGIGFALARCKKYIFLLLAFFVPYAVLTFAIALKADRYIVPIYPVASILSVIYFDYVKHQKTKALFITVVTIFCISNFFGAVWAVGPMGMEGLKSILLPMPIGHPRRIHLNTMVWPPPRTSSNAQEIFSTISNDDRMQSPTVLMLFSYHDIDNALYALNAYHRLKRLDIQNFVGSTVQDPTATSEYIHDVLKNSDYIMIKSKVSVKEIHSPVNYMLLKTVQEEFTLLDEKILLSYKKYKTVQVPIDKSTVVIYKRKNAIPKEILQDFKRNIKNNLDKKVDKR